MNARNPGTAPAAPGLIGLVLAGGMSLRMGRDKGSLQFRGRPLVEHALAALRPFAEAVFVSLRDGQSAQPPYAGLPVIVDAAATAGPGAGLLAAWTAHPKAALLVLAVDMPLVDRNLLAHLTGHRAGTRAATAYRHADGTPEPLCAIWEPAMAGVLRQASDRRGPFAPSLRRILEAADVAWLAPPDPSRLASLNTPAALAAAESQESNSTR